MNETPVIEARGLTTAYDGRVINENVSFSVRRGEVFVVVGGSGCGKSTLLRHLVGLQQPVSGDVLIKGESLVAAEGARREALLRTFGVLFQSGALFGSMTVAENVELPLEEYTSLAPASRELLVRMKLSLVGLTGSENQVPSELSGGMRKRAGLARAMALDPDILFFDEPSAGLDPVTSAQLDNLVIQLNKSLGTTMVVVTHELASIFAIADRVIMLDKETKGIIAEGTPEELKNDKTNAKAYAFFNRRDSSQFVVRSS